MFGLILLALLLICVLFRLANRDEVVRRVTSICAVVIISLALVIYVGTLLYLVVSAQAVNVAKAERDRLEERIASTDEADSIAYNKLLEDVIIWNQRVRQKREVEEFLSIWVLRIDQWSSMDALCMVVQQDE